MTLRVVADISWSWNPGDDFRPLRAVEPRDRRVRPARDDNLSPDHFDTVKPADASRDHAGRAVAGLPCHHGLAAILHDDEPPSHRVERDPVGPAESVTSNRDGHFAIWSDPEHAVRPWVEDVPHVIEPDTGVGEVDRAVGSDRDVIEEYRTEGV